MILGVEVVVYIKISPTNKKEKEKYIRKHIQDSELVLLLIFTLKKYPSN